MFKRTDWFIGLALVAVIVAIFAFSLTMAPKPAEGEEAFGGSDAAVTAILEDEHGALPWFSPIFEPGSGEIESGLFALQAALGAGLLGFALGNLRGRSSARKQFAADAAPGGTTQSTPS